MTVLYLSSTGGVHFHRTKFEEDMLCESAPDIAYDDHDVLSMIHACEQLDNVTYAPLGRIALYADILNLREERRLLNLHKHEVKILGTCVDCIYFEAAEANEPSLRDIFLRQLHQ